MPIVSNFPVLGGEKINEEQEITVVAADQIQIGDTVYTVAGDSTIYEELNSYVNIATFSPDGSALVLCGNFTGCTKIYSVNGTNITYVSDINEVSSESVKTAAFSPDGKVLVIGVETSLYIYSVNGTNITYISCLSTAFGGYDTAVFSPDGTTLVVNEKDLVMEDDCQEIKNNINVYSVAGTNITYVGTTGFGDCAAFSPDGSALVIGGDFTGHAKVYSVSGTNITYVRYIYANAGTTWLSNAVNTAAFSPDGSTLVLGGDFDGRAKVYSVSGTTISYVSDIYADAGTTALSSSVNTATFSPDGSTLVLGGGFTGYAKVYSVNGTNITYVSDIYADGGTTILDGPVNTAAFSPDGSTLVLGGGFTDYAISKSVLGNGILSVLCLAHRVVDGVVSVDQNMGIGFSKQNIDSGDMGEVTIFATATRTQEGV